MTFVSVFQFTGWVIVFISFFFFILYLSRWFGDILLESYEGHHVEKVANGLRLGFLLMILSEIMFFFSFFWCFFHISFSLSIFTGLNWPYINYPSIYLPLFNTLILSVSSWTLTQAQNCYLKLNQIPDDYFTYFHENPNHERDADYKVWITINSSKYVRYIKFYLTLTLYLGLWFTWIQYQEYCDVKNLTFNNGCAGSIFYMLTGFHGLHVIIGSIFIFITRRRVKKFLFLKKRFLLLEMTLLYWHFVDVVWWFLFLFIYL